MISTSFIHACDDANKFEEQYLNDMSFFESQFSMIAYYDKKMENIMLFEGTESDDLILIQESIATILSSVGQKVIDICSRIKKFIKDQVDMVRKYFWDKKDLPTKIKNIAKKNPNAAAAEIKTLAQSGKLDVDDIRVLSGCYKEIDNVIDEINKGKRDPKSLQAKLDKIEDTFNSAKKVLLVGAEVAGAIVTIGKVAELISRHNPSKDKTLEDIESQARTTAVKLEQANARLQDPNDQDSIQDCRSRLNVLARAAAVTERITNGSISRRTRANLALGRAAERINNRFHMPDTGANARDRVLNRNARDANNARRNANVAAEEIRRSTAAKSPIQQSDATHLEVDTRTGQVTRQTNVHTTSSRTVV